jgi:hypothetical protein
MVINESKDTLVLILYKVENNVKNTLFWCLGFFSQRRKLLSINLFEKKPSGIDFTRHIKTIKKDFSNLKTIIIEPNKYNLRSLLDKRLDTWNNIGIVLQNFLSEKDSLIYEEYFEYLLNKYKDNGLTLKEYLKVNTFSSEKIKKIFIDPSINCWNNQLIDKDHEIIKENEGISEFEKEDNFLRKKSYLEYVKKELLAFPDNSNARLLALKIDTFLTSLKNEKKEGIHEFCQLVEKKLKKLVVEVQIGKENGLLEDILSIVGNNSLRFQEYRIIQFQIIFIFLAYSNLKLKDLRIMSLEKLNDFLLAPKILSPKGVQLLNDRKELIQIFFEKHPYLGSCFKTKSSSLISSTSFSTMINEELKRVVLILVKLNKYKVGMDLITPTNLKYLLGDYNLSP